MKVLLMAYVFQAIELLVLFHINFCVWFSILTTQKGQKNTVGLAQLFGKEIDDFLGKVVNQLDATQKEFY
jgi:hypothetical protein